MKKPAKKTPPPANIGPCDCGHLLPDLEVTNTAVVCGKRVPPRIVMICPHFGQKWELGLTLQTGPQ